MLTIWLFGFIAAAVITAAMLYRRSVKLLSEEAIVIGVVTAFTIGVGLLSYPIAHHFSQNSAIGGYHQFLNGSLVSYDTATYTCSKDGPCTHEYNCDPYWVKVVDRYAYTDSDHHYHPEVSHQERRYHDCPYTTKEYTYTLNDTFGNTYTLGNHVFSAHPKRWSSDRSIPGDIREGAPERWLQAKDNIKAGNADPVTVPATYKNYILADQKTLLRAHSDDIALLKKSKLLPDPTNNMNDPIHDNYLADKVTFVGMKSDDSKAWQSALMHFNAALGMEHQGDMHVVAIKASAIPASVSPEDYANALKAYWLNDIGKYALAKNGIMLVLAVDVSGATVLWSKAATGMPIGNGGMLQALSTQLDGQAFSPDVVFGTVAARVNGKQKVSYSSGTGIVPGIVLDRFPFKRACMACADKEDKGQVGFVHLSTEIPLGKGAIVWTVIIDLLLNALLAFGAIYWLDVMLTNKQVFFKSTTY